MHSKFTHEKHHPASSPGKKHHSDEKHLQQHSTPSEGSSPSEESKPGLLKFLKRTSSTIVSPKQEMKESELLLTGKNYQTDLEHLVSYLESQFKHWLKTECYKANITHHAHLLKNRGSFGLKEEFSAELLYQQLLPFELDAKTHLEALIELYVSDEKKQRFLKEECWHQFKERLLNPENASSLPALLFKILPKFVANHHHVKDSIVESLFKRFFTIEEENELHESADERKFQHMLEEITSTGQTATELSSPAMTLDSFIRIRGFILPSSYNKLAITYRACHPITLSEKQYHTAFSELQAHFPHIPETNLQSLLQLCQNKAPHLLKKQIELLSILKDRTSPDVLKALATEPWEGQQEEWEQRLQHYQRSDSELIRPCHNISNSLAQAFPQIEENSPGSLRTFLEEFYLHCKNDPSLCMVLADPIKAFVTSGPLYSTFFQVPTEFPKSKADRQELLSTPAITEFLKEIHQEHLWQLTTFITSIPTAFKIKQCGTSSTMTKKELDMAECKNMKRLFKMDSWCKWLEQESSSHQMEHPIPKI